MVSELIRVAREAVAVMGQNRKTMDDVVETLIGQIEAQDKIIDGLHAKAGDLGVEVEELRQDNARLQARLSALEHA